MKYVLDTTIYRETNRWAEDFFLWFFRRLYLSRSQVTHILLVVSNPGRQSYNYIKYCAQFVGFAGPAFFCVYGGVSLICVHCRGKLG